MNIETFYQGFCKETFDENGVLNTFEPVLAENFNFAYDIVDEIARQEPDRRAMVWCNETGESKTFTFGEMKRYSDKCAQMLAARGIIKGDTVLLSLRCHYEFWFTILALHKLGAVAVPVSHTLTVQELLRRFQVTGITACVVSGEGITAQAVEEACEEYHDMRAKFLVRGHRDGWIDYQQELEKQDGNWTRVSLSKTDPMLLYFTSGIADEPRIALHDHTYPAAHILTARYWQDIHSEDLHMGTAETGWMKAVWGKLYGQWFVGACILVYDFDCFVARDLLAVMAQYKVTSFCAPPIVYRSLLREHLAAYDLSALRSCTAIGDSLSPEIFTRWKKQTGLAIKEAFGQTETVIVAANLTGSEPKPGSMGKPSPLFSIRLTDEDGIPLPPGAAGEICIDTNKPHSGLFREYYHNEELTKSVWHDGLYHTGDMAWMDEEGYLWYIGRQGDLIKASGYRISPHEIENVLAQHPAVAESAVLGISDPARGTVVKAIVVLEPEVLPSEALKKELQDFVKKHAAPYKYPRVVEFIPALPRTLSGKVRRSDLRTPSETNFS